MTKLSDSEVREALDKVYSEESSALEEELMRMQLASLPNEDWRFADEDKSDESDEHAR